MDFPSIRNRNWTLYDYARIIFLVALSVATTSVLGVAIGTFVYSIDSLSILVQNPSVDFFGNSLNLILSIFSITFLIVIFLVQNANQKYSNRLSRVIFHDRYFLGSAAFIIFASVFNLSGSYFDWQAPLTTIGFAFSIASILIAASLIFLAGYFIDVSNIVEYLTKQYKEDISADKLYLEQYRGTKPQNKEYIKELTTNAQLISSTCIRAIEENNHTLANTCFNSLLAITKQYLLQTDTDDPNDDFLKNLNDEFQFIGSTAFEEDIRQKYAQDLAETVGKIGIWTTKRREMGTPGGIWGKLLKRLFEDAVEFDRNKVGPISIGNLGEMSKIAILKGDHDSFALYLSDLKEIAAICINRNETYFNNLVGNVSQQFQLSYIAFISSLCNNGIYSEYDIKRLLTVYSEIFVVAKSTFGFSSRSTLFSSIKNPMQPFSVKLAGELHRHYPLEIARQNKLTESLLFLNIFVQNIGAEIETNERDLYSIYVELLYLYAQFTPVNQQARLRLLLDLNKKWIGLIDDTYRHTIENDGRRDYDLEYRTSEVYAIIIYFYRYNSNVLSEFINPLLQEYNELKSDFSGQNRTAQNHIEQLYLQLKLVGAWIEEINDLEAVSPELKEILVDDFYESNKIDTQIPFRGIEKYNYPVSDQTVVGGSRSGWNLRQEALWSERFQQNISNLVNGGNGMHYETFHEKLRARHNLQKAGKTGAVIRSILADKS